MKEDKRGRKVATKEIHSADTKFASRKHVDVGLKCMCRFINLYVRYILEWVGTGAGGGG